MSEFAVLLALPENTALLGKASPSSGIVSGFQSVKANEVALEGLLQRSGADSPGHVLESLNAKSLGPVFHLNPTLSIFSCIVCSRSVRVPTLMLVVIRGAPMA